VLILSSGPLDAGQQTALKALHGTAESSAPVAATVHDVSATQDPFIQQLWTKYGLAGTSQPMIVTLYPERSSLPVSQIAATATFSGQNIGRSLNSPARTSIVKRLAAGHSAVWILLESGNAMKDQAARTALEEQLAKDAEWLKLPSPEEMEISPELLNKSKIRLQIEFSVLAICRDDDQEKFLVDCLLNSESDLRDFDEPIAFPVFGRGRVLYALIGSGISTVNIRKASSFIVGPCSCQVKEQNPGFDLLLSCDWNELVGDTLISQPAPEENAEPKLLKIPTGRPREKVPAKDASR